MTRLCAELLAVLYVVIDGVVRRVIDGVVRRVIDGVVRRVIDGVVRRAIDGVARRAIDGVARSMLRCKRLTSWLTACERSMLIVKSIVVIS